MLVTLLLFIFMNYLLGNFDKYAQSITESLFSLRLVKLDKNSAVEAQTSDVQQRIQPPPERPGQTQTQPNDKPVTNEQRRRMMIEALLGKREESDNSGNADNNPSNPE